ncbi:MAG: cystathionine beta-lyase [Rickettsiales bacterium]|nr:cystathionine beta-lyase [Rickettsiales bacterium]
MRKETLLATLGCNPEDHRGVVSTPVYRSSTILFPNLSAFEAADNGEASQPIYGRYGTRTTTELEEALATLEGADHAIITSSGLAAIVVALSAFLKSGDHLLMVDTTYGATRRYCDIELKRFGVETTYYDPTIGAGIAALIRENTRIIYVESPGSLTLEMQDVPAIAKVAKERGILIMGDNTWATPLYYDAFAAGQDISISSATKYVSGHSDIVMGVIACKEAHYGKLIQRWKNTGACVSPDTAYLAHRGLRTMAVRLEKHQQNALSIAAWLKARPEVEEVFYPALPGAPGHDLWKRDFTGACGLFAFALKEKHSHAALSAMLDNMELFGMGYSWGGYESLITPVNLAHSRSATRFAYKGSVLRVHIGLEHVEDVRTDLENGLMRLRNA